MVRYFLICLYVFSACCTYAQNDSNSTKKYNIRIAADFKFEQCTDLGTVPGWVGVWGVGGDLIIQNHKSTGIMCGLNYRNKNISYGFPSGRISYAVISLNFRKDTKVIYFGAGIAGEFFVGENMIILDTSVKYPNLLAEQGYVNVRKVNLGINGFIGIDKTINKKLNLFVQGQFLKDIFSPLPPSLIPISTTPIFSYSFLNFGISLGLDYHLN